MKRPFFFFRNRRFAARIGHVGEFDHFFGHSEDLILQKEPAVGYLHQLITLDLRDPSVGLQIEGLNFLPLLYGFQFDGCQLEYSLVSDNAISILKLDENRFDKSWPYSDYPARFPKIPFSLNSIEDCTLEEFEQDLWQGVSRTVHKDKFICVVPPNPSLYKVNLWEKEREYEYVNVKFFVDPLKRHVFVENETD
jgi:hypothetical protein